MKNLSEKQLLIISITVAVLLAVLFLWMTYKQHEEWTVLQESIDRARSENDTLQSTKVSKIPGLKKQLEKQREEKTGDYDLKLPDDAKREAAYQEMIEKLQKYAESTKISISEVKEVVEKKKKGSEKKKVTAKEQEFKTQQFEYVFAARFENAIQFINAIENEQRILRVDRLSIEADGGGDGVYDMTLQFTAFTFSPVEQKTAAPAPAAKGAKQPAKEDAASEKE